jgi:hypothetical protein
MNSLFVVCNLARGWIRGVRFPGGAEIFVFTTTFRLALLHTSVSCQTAKHHTAELNMELRLRMDGIVSPIYFFMV